MTDDELMRFCSVNEIARVERDANGELILTSLTGLAWLIDPQRKVVEIYRPGEEPKVGNIQRPCRKPDRVPTFGCYSSAPGAEDAGSPPGTLRHTA